MPAKIPTKRRLTVSKLLYEYPHRFGSECTEFVGILYKLRYSRSAAFDNVRRVGTNTVKNIGIRTDAQTNHNKEIHRE